MCRSIKVLRKADPPATHDDIHAAARQFVRKISGYAKPAKKNEDVFELAVKEITESASRLLESLRQ
jgi:hypothetical protein